MRVTFHGAYAIYYKQGYYTQGSGELVIVRVLHGARDVVAIAESGGLR